MNQVNCTKRPAVGRSDAKKQAPSISETGAKKPIASELNKLVAKMSIASGLSKPRTGEISCKLKS